MNQDGKADGYRNGSRTRPRRTATSASALGDLTQKRIGFHLRDMYDSVIQQPVPDRFRDLISQLDSGEPSSKG